MNKKSLWLLWPIVFLIFAGCENDEVTKYRVKKLKVESTEPELPTPEQLMGQREMTMPDQSTQRSTATTLTIDPARLVTAIVDREDGWWTFKIVGPKEIIDETEPQWKTFFQQLSFDDSGTPKWELPDGWSEGEGGMFRYTSFVIGNYQPPLEMTVSRLAAGQDLLDNVNRWRVKQLGLADIDAAGLDDSLQKLEYKEGSLLIFDEIGKFTNSISPPFANRPPASSNMSPNSAHDGTSVNSGTGGSDPASGQKTTEQNNNDQDSIGQQQVPFTYELPDGWNEIDPGMFVLLKLNTGDNTVTETEESDNEDDPDDDRQEQSPKSKIGAQISVSQLPQMEQVTDWNANIKRWCRELERDQLSAEQISEQTQPVNVDKIKGKQISIEGGADSNPKAYRVAMIERDQKVWFFKMVGDRDTLESNREKFDSFLESIKFN